MAIVSLFGIGRSAGIVFDLRVEPSGIGIWCIAVNIVARRYSVGRVASVPGRMQSDAPMSSSVAMGNVALGY